MAQLAQALQETICTVTALVPTSFQSIKINVFQNILDMD